MDYTQSESEPDSPVPINLRNKPPGDDTGFLVIRLKPGGAPGDTDGMERTDALLKRLAPFRLVADPLINRANAGELRKLQERTSGNKFAPKHSLLSYWRIDTRQSSRTLAEIEAALRHDPDVDLVYRDKVVSDPLSPANDPHSSKEKFLNAAPLGVDARWVWNQPYGDGSGMHFIDLEQGWILDHEDLAPPKEVIFNSNHDGILGFEGSHGTAVLGIVAGVDNALGIIGVAPKVASVRVVSHWNEVTNLSNVTDALTAAITAPVPPHVLLIEAQVGADNLPVETAAASFDAIGLGVAAGIIIIEAGGNGNVNLDNWTDSAGKHRLNRNSPEGRDSGAILVGAGKSKLPHNRSIWPGAGGSNFGSRIDCYAWGDSIVSAGYGSLGGFGANSYTKEFGGTSGAASIIAGCALLLQGRKLGKTGSLFSPEEMREALADVETGTPQGAGVAGHIGVMPDLKKVVNKRVP